MFTFPEEIDGWLTEAEGMALATYASNRRVLEIGSYKGRSSICMAQTAQHLDCIDPFDGRATPNQARTLADFRANLYRYNVQERVGTYIGTTADMAPGLEPGYDLVFIDGDHAYGNVRADIEAALKLLAPHGLIAFHDYRRACNPGVTRAVDDLLGDGGCLIQLVDTVALVKPPRDLLTGELDRRKVVLVMPYSGSIRCSAAADAFHEYPSARSDVHFAKMKMSSSVLTLNLNRLWCEALNLRAAGFTDLVMLHDDVCPAPGWVDVLLAEKDRLDADVVSAIVPIKSIHGLTSTALGWGPPHGNIFRALRRLTMREVMELPETFCREDVSLEGPPLLFINTGCYIVDLTKPWVTQNCFRNVERNIEINGRWKADCLSEDWAWSVDLARWGAKVYATRKVALSHGREEFHNTSAWGSWETDQEYFERIKQQPPPPVREPVAAVL